MRRSARRVLVVAAAGVVVAGGVVTVGAATAPAAPGRVVGRYGLPLDVDPASPSMVAVRGLPDRERIALTAITAEPQAVWLTAATGVEQQVHELVEGAASRSAVATLVLYRIPHRDCGSYSSARDDLDAAGYRAWVARVVAGLGHRRTIVVVEPDALAAEGCLTVRQRRTRTALLRDAVRALAGQGSWVYVDAGHAKWKSAATMAARLKAVGAGGRIGFAVNVSGYGATAAEVRCGRAIAAALGGARFVVDVSRNGATVPAGRWCNAPGARLGAAPTALQHVRAVDALLWIKTPGTSDGSCRGGPRAGAFWPAAAARLLR